MKTIFKTYSQVFLSEGLGDKAPLFYAKRRQEHLKKLDSICIYGATEVENGERICQNPDFLYLTGINQSGAILVLDPLAKEEREILFLAEKDAKKEFWNGIRLGLPEPHIKEITGFETVFSLKEFDDWLKKRLEDFKKKHIFSNETISKKLANHKLKVLDISKIHFAQRVVLEPERIVFAKKAQIIAKNAFLSILPRIGSYKNERVLAAKLEYFMLSQTNNGLAFPSIIAAGKNACTLHYAKKDCPIEKENLILLDFGCRYNTVCSDISRTIPASGKFNPLQKLLYNIVLDTQKFHEKNVKAGLTLGKLGKEAWLFMEKLLAERFTNQGGKMKRCYSGKPHGISHLIGDIVHEGAPNRDYLKAPLKPGMLISNEPGLYGHFEFEIDGILYSEDIGIRIEDNLLVIKGGCENLSREIPKEIWEIEKKY
ncbi:MAG: aminopeptidase P N-terminal domain-containing protein [Fibromonadaceae bacterium]|jgi:Xaa-Pro aminopeptidase|nr:aminopeptidase P N-terminal domain-containing protein [Fibromonadaceae bacterium]